MLSPYKSAQANTPSRTISGGAQAAVPPPARLISAEQGEAAALPLIVVA
jgi:hypothetical protein